MSRLLLISVLLMSSLLSSCDSSVMTKVNSQSSTAQSPKPIVILYDNDVHCAVDGYSKLVALRDIMLDSTDFVTTVSCGDFSSGGLIAATSEGELVIDVMNKVGYDVVTLGNHELDYGMEQLFVLADALDAQVVCANLKNVQTDEYPFPAYHIVNYGDVDVAYLGFTTTSSGTAVSLSDKDFNPLYSFMREEFYDNAQKFIDKSRDNGAEYVVALAHLGDDRQIGDIPNSTSLINNTTGIDAVIDGHDHHVIEERWVTNKDGNAVLLTSSGFAFENIGVLRINADGSLSSKLINIESDTSLVDIATQRFVDSIKMEVEASGQKVVGYLDMDLDVCDEDGNRLVRSQQTGIGGFLADAFRDVTGADVALVNGGGIRAGMKRGEVTINDILSVMPFGNLVCTATMTGQQLLDAMEFSVSALPYESGSFLQVSGMSYEVDASVPTPVALDDECLFSYVGDGRRRISDLKILNAKTNTYEPVILEMTYSVASFDYLLTEFGGSGILRYAQADDRYWGTDLEVLADFFKSPRH